jgi:hypothetical protein
LCLEKLQNAEKTAEKTSQAKKEVLQLEKRAAG